MIKYNGKDIIPRIDGKEISRVMYNGKQIYPNNNVIEIQLADVVAGDICVFDGTNKRFFRFVDSGATDDIKKYTPIGVVVIPTSHDVYGTGECGVMSLKEMDCDTPSIGGTSGQTMYWGLNDTDISTLSNLNRVPILKSDSNVGDASSTVTGEHYSAFLPTDRIFTSSAQCPHDTDKYYSVPDSNYQAPSPYLTDDSRNPAYYQTSSPSSSNNALADFDGKNNTQKIITQRGTKDYNSWKPTYNVGIDYPAASCCDMFHTDGTSQGDWYLPACGELGYILVHNNKINEVINKICTVYNSSIGVELNNYRRYCSSTEYDSYSIQGIYMSIVDVESYIKESNYHVRAYLRVGTT